MSSKNGNVEDIVEQIVCISLLSDKEYNSQNKEVRRNAYQKQKDAVNNAIDQMCKRIEQNLPEGVSMPKGIRADVANQFLIEVENDHSLVINGFKISEEKLMVDLKIPNKNNWENTNQDLLNKHAILESQLVAKEQMQEIATKFAPGSQMAADIIANAKKTGATKDEQDMYVGLQVLDQMTFMSDCDIGLDGISEYDKGFFMQEIVTLQRNGKEDDAKKIMEAYGITQDMVDNPQNSLYEFLDNTVDENDAAMSREIEAFAGKFKVMLSKTLTPEKRQVACLKLLEEIQDSKLSIDSIFAAFSRIEDERDFKDENVMKFTQVLLQKLEDPNVDFEIEGFVASDMIAAINKMAKVDPEMARRITDGFNDRAKSAQMQTIKFEDIIKLDDRSVKNLLVKSDEYKRGQDGYSNICNEVKTGSIKSEVKSINYTYDYQRINKPPVEAMRDTMIRIWQSVGMEGVLKYMQKNCVENNISIEQRKVAEEAFRGFLSDGYSPADEQQKIDDSEMMKTMIKSVTAERGEELFSDKIAYQFIQDASSFVKSTAERTSEQVLSIDDIETEQIVGHFSDGKDSLVKGGKISPKSMDERNDGDELEL